MSMIQIRNVPEELHRKLKARAALKGMSLSELALNELSRAMSAPSQLELREKFTNRDEQPYGGETAAESTRAERDAM